MSKIKITVIKKILMDELVKEHAKNTQAFSFCTVFNEGDTFTMEAGEMPRGFCPWAFTDIHRDIMAVRFGGDIPWIREKGTAICSCTDGLRPVIFKVERVED